MLVVSRAPLRIPLGGGGTDFPSYYLKHGGYILGFAITRYVTVVLNDTIDGKVRLKYSKNEVVNNADELENRVAAEALKSYGITKGIEIATFADVPECSGLGGSSAFCVALVVALRHRLGLSMDKYDIFQSAFCIERIKADQPGGIQDQMFASCGGAWDTHLDKSNFELNSIDISGLLLKLKLVYTNATRTNLEIAVKQTWDTQQGTKEVLDSLALTKKLGLEIRECIKSGNLDEIGRLFHTHWLNKQKRSALISSSELDSIYGRAMRSGATGGKLLGLGGGGYFLFYVPDKLEGFDTVDFGIDTEGCKIVYSN